MYPYLIDTIVLSLVSFFPGPRPCFFLEIAGDVENEEEGSAVPPPAGSEALDWPDGEGAFALASDAYC